jgi:predicted lipid-binding transport protein (Tim44 family)
VNYEIILLAMVAAFLGMRLYSVLGKRSGHEQEPVTHTVAEERNPAIVRQPIQEPATAPKAVGESVVDNLAASGIRAISNADRQFDPLLFMEGARTAYGLVLESFWKGDKDTLRFLCDSDVYESFSDEIDAREARGEVLEYRLVRIEDSMIIDAAFDHPLARITVRFDADVSALVKDTNGNVIGGSMTDAVDVHEIWTFSRDLKSNDRNWKLDETDAV